MEMNNLLARSSMLLIAGFASIAWAQPLGPSHGREVQRNEGRASIQMHRQARRQEVRREEALAGPRLTAEERAELREQLRREWAGHGETAQTAQTTPAYRSAPGWMPPRTQRH